MDSRSILSLRKSDAQPSTAIVFLVINDVYIVQPNSRGMGGFAELAVMVRHEKQKIRDELGPDVPVIFCLNGDFMAASEAAVATQGKCMIELFNELEVDTVVIGNHEFDFGGEVLKQRIKESNFKWFGSNIKELSTGKLLDGVLDTWVLEVPATAFIKADSSKVENGVKMPNSRKIGFFGVCTDETPDLSDPGDNIVFEDVIETAKKCVKKLKEQGVDIIVAFTHVWVHDDQRLAMAVPEIDLILGGHDHEPITLTQGKTTIFKAGQNAYWLGRVDMEMTPTDEVVCSWKMMLNKDIQPDPKIAAHIQKSLDSLTSDAEKERAKQVLTVSKTELCTLTRRTRAGFSNFANMVADAMRAELNAEFGWINGGFIRGDKVYPANYNVTVGMILEEMPFPREAVLIKIKGKYLRSALEHILSKWPDLSGGHPHLSGMHVVYDADLKKITTFQTSELVDIPEEKDCHIATTFFIARGGDGNAWWEKGETVKSSDRIAEVVIRYLQKQEFIDYPESQEGENITRLELHSSE